MDAFLNFLIAFTIIFIIVRVGIFFFAPDLDALLSVSKSSNRKSHYGHKSYKTKYIDHMTNSVDSPNHYGQRMEGSDYSPNIGIHDDN